MVKNCYMTCSEDYYLDFAYSASRNSLHVLLCKTVGGTGIGLPKSKKGTLKGHKKKWPILRTTRTHACPSHSLANYGNFNSCRDCQIDFWDAVYAVVLSVDCIEFQILNFMLWGLWFDAGCQLSVLFYLNSSFCIKCQF